MTSEDKMITLFLMTYKGYSALEELVRSGKAHFIDKVIIGHDKNVSRDYSEEIRNVCIENSIPFEKNNNSNEIHTKYAVAVSWKWIIDAENFRLIVIHDSLLPKYRGFAPLVSSLKNGEKETGVTAIFAERSYDKGEIIHQLKTDIVYPKRINDLIKEISVLYNQMIVYLFDHIEKGTAIASVRQNESDATYSLWLDDDDYMINWEHSSEEILRFINAVSEPYKGASANFNDEKVRITAAEPYPDLVIENRCPGKVIFKEDGFPVVVCGKGLIKLLEITNELNESILPLKQLRLRFKNCNKGN